MAELVLEKTCRLSGAGQTPYPMRWLRGSTEIMVEALQKLGEALDGQVKAGLKAMEGGLAIVAVKEPAELPTRLADAWQKNFECLWPLMELPVQAARFAVALGTHLADGMQTVSEEAYQRRLAICRECEWFRGNHCLQCGCRVEGDVVAKARWKSETCPLGYWSRRA
jgi:hypothetical protein